MALSWLSVLQAVPWSEVISNAPKVADGARKLWSTVAKRPAPDQRASAEDDAVGAAARADQHAQSMAALAGRITDLEVQAARLREEMLASSELIQALADQNAQLIRRVETHRLQIRWLGGVAVLASGLAALALWWAAA